MRAHCDVSPSANAAPAPPSSWVLFNHHCIYFWTAAPTPAALATLTPPFSPFLANDGRIKTIIKCASSKDRTWVGQNKKLCRACAFLVERLGGVCKPLGAMACNILTPFVGFMVMLPRICVNCVLVFGKFGAMAHMLEKQARRFAAQGRQPGRHCLQYVLEHFEGLQQEEQCIYTGTALALAEAYEVTEEIFAKMAHEGYRLFFGCARKGHGEGAPRVSGVFSNAASCSVRLAVAGGGDLRPAPTQALALMTTWPQDQHQPQPQSQPQPHA